VVLTNRWLAEQTDGQRTALFVLALLLLGGVPWVALFLVCSGRW